MSTGRRAYDILRSYVNREWDRLAGVEQSQAEWELYESMGTPKAPQSPSQDAPLTQVDQDAIARQVLGVNPGAPFADVRKAYERLKERSNPENFPEGSTERSQAEKIHSRVEKAYRILSTGVDETEKRFRTLEI